MHLYQALTRRKGRYQCLLPQLNIHVRRPASIAICLDKYAELEGLTGVHRKYQFDNSQNPAIITQHRSIGTIE